MFRYEREKAQKIQTHKLKSYNLQRHTEIQDVKVIALGNEFMKLSSNPKRSCSGFFFVKTFTFGL